MQDDTLELLISIGHYARVHGRFDEARYLFERLARLYPQRAFPYLGLGLVEIDRANYRAASVLFGRAVEVAPDSALARAWLGVCQVFEGHYALGARTLSAVANGDEPGASSMAAAFLNLPECLPYRHAARATQAERAVGPVSTIERLTIRGSH
ncbi:tetratricopeptide repeat protein [Paraburkholderia sp. RL17-337-BIB-A]|uniref:tetratricopeptide repeat protein n=1 Tax=Paraburkholderia sp. RL17-337-BIB-A TaxID=3031636 RepID=UPI0038B974E5